MPNILTVEMTEEQINQTLIVLGQWEEDKKLCGLIVFEGISSDDENPDSDQVTLRVSGEIKYDAWNEFCQEIGIKIDFPGW